MGPNVAEMLGIEDPPELGMHMGRQVDKMAQTDTTHGQLFHLSVCL